jgi:hypothetical protein
MDLFNNSYKKLLLSLSTLLLANPIFAHTVDYVLDKKNSDVIFSEYVQHGFQHIIPLGLDHIFFIICIFFLNTNIKSIIKQATLFTIAHSITLMLAMKNIIVAPPQIIEPLIALSIVALAAENIIGKSKSSIRSLLIFAFGLLHGMGFASALSSLDFPMYDFSTALIAFNIGVELGQISIILAMYLGIQLIFSAKAYYRTRILIPANVAIGLVAIYWTLERIF